MVTKVDHPDKVYTMDGTDHRLVVGTKGRHVWIWDQRNMKVVEQRRESSLKHQTRCIKTFPNGLGYALSSIEGRVAVEYFDTNPEAQKQKFAFKCHREKVDNQNVIYPVTALAFHKQHGSFASGGCDGKVNIWDPINKKRLCQFPKQETSIASISFNGEGNLMAVASSYMFEEGEKDHPPDSIKINFITEEMGYTQIYRTRSHQLPSPNDIALSRYYQTKLLPKYFGKNLLLRGFDQMESCRAYIHNDRGDYENTSLLLSVEFELTFLYVQYTKLLDGDIEKVCNKNYHGFLESVAKLLKVRANAASLNQTIEGANEEKNAVTVELLDRSKKLQRLRKIQKNVAITINNLKDVIPVLRLYGKANAQFAQRRFYASLKTLQELEEVHLPKMRGYSFAGKLEHELPKLTKRIRTAAHSELQDFLASIRLHSAKIGATVMAHTARKLGLEESDINKSIEESATSTNTEDHGLEASEQADFSPIYRCLHIHDVLCARAACVQYYTEERKKQSQQLLRPRMKLVTTKQFCAYFEQLAGFFVVEDTILATTNIISRSWVDEIWDEAHVIVTNVIEGHLNDCNTAEMILEVKRLVVLFSHTLESYGYKVVRIFDTLSRIFDRYTTVLKQGCSLKFKDALTSDNYSPMQVYTKEEYEKVITSLRIRTKSLRNAAFPRCFPFSTFVPTIQMIVENFIDSCVDFVIDLDLSQTEIDELIRKATNDLLARNLNSVLAEVIRKSHMSLPQLAQLSVNMSHLQKSSQKLEKYISELTRTHNNSVHNTSLHGSEIFQGARSAAEEEIRISFTRHIDQFFELADYDLAPTSPRLEPSDFICDLLNYLSTTFGAVTNMPSVVARSAYFHCCKHMSTKLKSILCSPEVTPINTKGIKSLSLDVDVCVEFANRCPLVDKKDQMLSNVFSELKELLGMIVDQDWSGFTNSAVRASKYANVKVSTALKVIDKFDDSVKNPNRQQRRTEKERKKELDIFKKTLTQLSIMAVFHFCGDLTIMGSLESKIRVI
eukprot:UC4_evm15s507